MGTTSAPLVIGRYTIHSKIAAGGMASVHFGRMAGSAGFARTVAIKRLHPHLAEHPDFMATLIDEARMVARIHHPNVVPTLDVVAADGELLLVMEYVRGESLSQLLRGEAQRGGRTPLSIASAVIVGALHGLHAAHEATSDTGEPLQIVHRDISPQNVLVGVDGLPRVIDFGVAKAAGRLQTTRDGALKGKMAYMAPEHLMGHTLTRATDIYAMGVVLWETLTCMRLFDGETEASVVAKVFAGAKVPPSRFAPDVPEALDALVMRAIALDSAERYATAAEMADALTLVAAPALPTYVGAWCATVAREALGARGALLAEIESGGATIATLPPITAEVDPHGSTSVASQAAPDDIGLAASQASQLSMSAPRIGTQSTMRPWSAALVGTVSVLALLLGVRIVTLVGTGPATSGLPAATPTPSASTDDPSGTSTPSANPIPLPAAVTPATAAPVTPVPVTPPPATATPATPVLPAPPTRTPRPSARTPASANCAPNYVLDSSGNKHFKPECFTK